MEKTRSMWLKDPRIQRQYNLFCHGKLNDPFPLFHRLQREDPVHWSVVLESWLVTRYDDVTSAFLDPRLSARRVPIFMSQIPEPVRTRVKPLAEHFEKWLGMTDPPDHTRLRTLIGRAFTPKSIEGMRGRIQEVVNDLLDDFCRKKQIDFVAEFAHRLPATVICEMLGIPTEDEDRFQEQVKGIMDFLGGAGPSLVRTVESSQVSLFESLEYFRALISERRRNPKSDLISAMVSVDEQDDCFTEDELIAMCIFLFFAGFETTQSLISNGLLALFQFPDAHQQLRNDLSLMPRAVEEFLRFYSPLQRQTRVATEEIKMHGRTIFKGQAVLLMQGAANRDPVQFEDPDRIDISRYPNRHVAFGLGSHFCLGAPLARLEGEIAFEAILLRFPALRIPVPLENLEWEESMSFLTLKSLPLILSYDKGWCLGS